MGQVATKAGQTIDQNIYYTVLIQEFLMLKDIYYNIHMLDYNHGPDPEQLKFSGFQSRYGSRTGI